jgi:predicted ABC-type exoprotein transport system permease subunit
VVGAAGASVAVSADRSGRVTAAVYWGFVFLLAVPSGVLIALSDEVSVGVIVFLICFPALQLAASFLALPVVALFPVDDKRRALGSLGVITAASFVGAVVIGLVGLVVGLLLLGAFS